ncbi:hypothetical protein SNEBB_002324 [Seison nebaliae]|nr:hypothetical protein SNEBB_002324 [Seison nebaliae]
MSTKYENMSSINSKINYDSFKQQYRYVDGSQYNGEWNKEGLRDGYGIFLTTNNGIYVGQFENGLSHGLGTLILSDNSRLISQN